VCSSRCPLSTQPAEVEWDQKRDFPPLVFRLSEAIEVTDNGVRAVRAVRERCPSIRARVCPLSTLHDRAMHALHALALDPIAETLADPYSYGFRQGRSCADALEH